METDFNDAEFEEDMKEEIDKIDGLNKDVILPASNLPDIPKQTGGIVKPIDVEGTLEAFKEFQKIKTKLLNDNDFMKFGTDGKPTDGEGKGYIKKEGWLKIKTAFGVSIALGKPYKSENEDTDGYYYMWTVPVRAIAPNGQFHEAYGACSSRKPFFSKKHGQPVTPKEEDILLTAQTVGINRAISGLVGGGELSAEEMAGTTDSTTDAPKVKPPIQRERKVFEGNIQELEPQTYLITAPKSKYYNKTFLQTPSSYIQWTIEQLDSGRLDMTRYGYQNDMFKEFLQCCFKTRVEYENSKKTKKEEK